MQCAEEESGCIRGALGVEDCRARVELDRLREELHCLLVFACVARYLLLTNTFRLSEHHLWYSGMCESKRLEATSSSNVRNEERRGGLTHLR